MAQDLHSFLSSYGKHFPSEIVSIDKPVSSRFEVTAIARAFEKQRRFPVLLFNKIETPQGISDHGLITFLLASRLRVARLLGTAIDQAGVAFGERMNRKVDPVMIARSQAPVKQVVAREGDVKLSRFPALHHHEQDPGPYITAGFLTCYNPETGLENSALHRGWIKDESEIRVEIHKASHNAGILRGYHERKQDMPVAFWIGHHPVAVLGCQARVAITESHYAAAGAFLGEPLRVVPSETLGDDFHVPADAEVVIEGYIPHDRFHPEGPFGEFTRYYGPAKPQQPFIHVTAVTHRRDAIWDDVLVGHPHWISSLQNEGAIYQAVKREIPTLINIHVPMSGCGVFHLYLQIHKTEEEMGKAAIAAGLAAHHGIKHVWVFDDDVDIFDDREVLWAMSTRFQGDRDMIVVPEAMGNSLDPSGHRNKGAKVGFDCTKPLKGFADRLAIPPAIEEKVQLKDYIDVERLEKIPFEPYG